MCARVPVKARFSQSVARNAPLTGNSARANPDSTRYTAPVFQLRIGPFPVRVELSFVITAALLGGFGIRSLPDIAAWVLLVFVSVLVHELGHALVALWQGGRPEIVLQGMGGVTFPRLSVRTSWAQQILLSIAGPLAGLLPGVLALVVLAQRHPGYLHGADLIWGQILRATDARDPLDRLLGTCAMMSALWTALNLMPVLPLDGGHVMEIALSALRKKPAGVLASWISAAFASLLALAIFLRGAGFWMTGIFFVAMALSSVGRARALGRGAPPLAREPGPDVAVHAQVAEAMARARAALSANDFAGAVRLAEPLENAPDRFRQSAGARIRAGVSLMRGEYLEAGREAGRAYALAPQPESAVLAARAALRAGQVEAARNWLKRAVEAGASVEALHGDAELGALA